MRVRNKNSHSLVDRTAHFPRTSLPPLTHSRTKFASPRARSKLVTASHHACLHRRTLHVACVTHNACPTQQAPTNSPQTLPVPQHLPQSRPALRTHPYTRQFKTAQVRIIHQPGYSPARAPHIPLSRLRPSLDNHVCPARPHRLSSLPDHFVNHHKIPCGPKPVPIHSFLCVPRQACLRWLSTV